MSYRQLTLQERYVIAHLKMAKFSLSREKEQRKGVDSTSKCAIEGVLNDFERSSVAEALARSIIERVNHDGKLLVADSGEIGAFGEVSAQHAVGVLVGAALPGTVGIGEIDAKAGCRFGCLEGGKLLAVVEGQRTTPVLGDSAERKAEKRVSSREKGQFFTLQSHRRKLSAWPACCALNFQAPSII